MVHMTSQRSFRKVSECMIIETVFERLSKMILRPLCHAHLLEDYDELVK